MIKSVMGISHTGQRRQERSLKQIPCADAVGKGSQTLVELCFAGDVAVIATTKLFSPGIQGIKNDINEKDT